MKQYLFLFIFILLSIFSIGQKSYQQFENEDDLHKKTEIGYALLFEYELNDLDSLRLLASQLLLSGKNNSFAYSVAMGEYGLGSYYLRKGNQNKSKKFLKSALVYFKSIEDYKLVSEILNEIWNSYAISSEYTNAIESYISSMDFGSVSKDATASFNGQIGLAKAYFALGDTLKGEITMSSYVKECIKHEKYQSISNAYSYLSMMEQGRGNKDESMIFLDKSIYYGLKSDSKLQLSHVYTNKAIVFFTTDEFDSSKVYFEKALELRIEVNRPRQICESYFNLASFYVETDDFKSAIIEVNNSINVAKKNSLLQDEYDGVELLEYIYGAMNDTVAKNKQTVLLAELRKELDDKKQLNKDLVTYLEEIELTDLSENELSIENEEEKSWMLIAGALIVLLAGGVITKSIFKMNGGGKV